MTDHKHLKARVRARMAKTGERYAAARAHVTGEGARAPGDTAAVGRDVGRREPVGVDPETTGLRMLLADAGHSLAGRPLSDPLGLVVGGGIGIGVFAFHYEKEGFSSFFLAGRHRWDDAEAYLAGAAARLGFRLATAEATSPPTAERRLREALERGPVIAWVDAATLGTRGLPPEMSGGGYHTLVVHRIDDAAGSATVSDLTDAPFDLPLGILAAARARIAKQRNRVGWLERSSTSDVAADVPAAVRDGLEATVEGFRNPRTRNFSLEALADWRDRLRGRGAASWDRIFAPGEWRWVGLSAIYEHVEHYGSGGGLGRGRFAAGLREAAVLLDRPRLASVAERYGALAAAWTALAAAALPDDVPLLRHTRDAHDRRAAAYARGGIASDGRPADGVVDASRDLARLRAEARASFPLAETDAASHLAGLADRVETIHRAEVEALDELAGALPA